MSSTQQLLLGEGAGGAAPVYIEDVFSTYLYTGTGAAQTITNNIDLSTKGGLVWIKDRLSLSGPYHALFDTARGAGNVISSNATDATNAYGSASTLLTSFGASGFSLGTDSYQWVNKNTNSFVSWTFREQPKFFDIVTYTGNGSARTINHNLGSTPGCIIIKRTDDTSNWVTWHRALPDPVDGVIFLNSTGTESIQGWFNNINSTSFSITGSSSVNANGGSYVVYLFAHNAGGFGTSGTDNVISCGSYTGTGSTLTVTLGYEVQWLLVKRANGSTANWILMDVMRGLSSTDAVQLSPNTSGADNNAGVQCNPIATGFQITSTGSNLNNSGNTYIYIAIRRGPMKVPTVGTSVYTPIYQTPQSAGTLRTVGFPADLMIGTYTAAATPRYVNTRLIGLANDSGSAQTTPKLATDSAAAQANAYPLFYDVWNTTARDGDYIFGSNGINWLFGRAPTFFDAVCYTGTGVAGLTVAHNLTVVPELMIVKGRSIAEEWSVYYGDNTKYLKLNSTDVAQTATTRWNDTSPTSSVFSLGTSNWVNGSGSTYVAYLFATCAGVSKVGSYTGDGTDGRVINCGFTTGARFVLIKKPSNTSGWAVWDSARGIVAGSDPYSLLNSATAQQTAYDDIDTDSTGFVVNFSGAGFPTNDSGVAYIFLAIA